jgi:hypothetical protein
LLQTADSKLLKAVLDSNALRAQEIETDKRDDEKRGAKLARGDNPDLLADR